MYLVSQGRVCMPGDALGWQRPFAHSTNYLSIVKKRSFKRCLGRLHVLWRHAMWSLACVNCLSNYTLCSVWSSVVPAFVSIMSSVRAIRRLPCDGIQDTSPQLQGKLVIYNGQVEARNKLNTETVDLQRGMWVMMDDKQSKEGQIREIDSPSSRGDNKGARTQLDIEMWNMRYEIACARTKQSWMYAAV